MVLLSACQDIDYKNNSGKDLVIEIYNYKNEFIKSFAIPDGDYITRYKVPAIFSFDSYKHKKGRPVIIRCNDNKCLYLDKYYSDKIFDIKRYDNFTEELIKQSEYRLTYIFKPEDYMQAVNCK